jgi:hypothetical protein
MTQQVHAKLLISTSIKGSSFAAGTGTAGTGTAVTGTARYL